MTHSIIQEAGAKYMQLSCRPALVLHLDAFDLVIKSTLDPEGDRLLLGFCLELAQEASTLASALAAKFTLPTTSRDEVQPHDH